VKSPALENPEIAERFAPLHPGFSRQEAVTEANLCLYCYDAPCAAACPTHIDVPRFIKKISTGNVRGSAVAILDANLLGASCSKVCPVDVLCEGACVMHRYNREPIEIGRLQRFAMESFLAGADRSLPPFPAPSKKLRVACVGAGPASLSCAGELARRGHVAVVFEGRGLPGGLNTYGVAEYKLRAAHALEETEFIASLGVEIRYGEWIDAARLQQLAGEYDAVFVGTGLGQTEPLRIPGEELEGVVDALRFIADYKTAQTLRRPRRAVVIGAGNTAIDAANAALRLGAWEVTIVYRRTASDMSAFAFEYERARQEGVHFRWRTSPVQIVGENGKVAALECLADGLEVILPCDTVIPAIGQARSSDLLPEAGGNVYAGGDLVNGGREVVDAVADGKRAALKMLEALRA
jgi:glutamate synthase (NADPH/NADH) small chain